ncbi:hypothetical protein SDC9_109510 [bioreactor metagenome]|uniref:Uncharacterized protein n=1 Tax=bioreactor metagenome TaxID=1076179 RepID=A0A645BHF4_9ZZZZ
MPTTTMIPTRPLRFVTVVTATLNTLILFGLTSRTAPAEIMNIKGNPTTGKLEGQILPANTMPIRTIKGRITRTPFHPAGTSGSFASVFSRSTNFPRPAR